MNKTILIGRLGKDAEMKEGKNGSFISYNLAVDDRKASGEKETTWYFCTQKYREGSMLPNYLKKGTLVYIEGRVTTFMMNDEACLSLYVYHAELLGGGEKKQDIEDNVPF